MYSNTFDIDARELTRKLLVKYAEGDDSFTCDEDFDEYIYDCLQYGMENIEGLIALFYRNIWAMADLHGRLKAYEDLEEQGRLPKLPCAVGDRIWDNDFGEPCSYTVSGFSFGDLNDLNDDNLEETDQIITYYTNSNGSITGRFPANKIGKTVFLTREEAMKAIGKENLNK